LEHKNEGIDINLTFLAGLIINMETKNPLASVRSGNFVCFPWMFIKVTSFFTQGRLPLGLMTQLTPFPPVTNFILQTIIKDRNRPCFLSSSESDTYMHQTQVSSIISIYCIQLMFPVHPHTASNMSSAPHPHTESNIRSQYIYILHPTYVPSTISRYGSQHTFPIHLHTEFNIRSQYIYIMHPTYVPSTTSTYCIQHTFPVHLHTASNIRSEYHIYILHPTHVPSTSTYCIQHTFPVPHLHTASNIRSQHRI
jgi:hypothetical protein